MAELFAISYVSLYCQHDQLPYFYRSIPSSSFCGSKLADLPRRLFRPGILFCLIQMSQYLQKLIYKETLELRFLYRSLNWSVQCTCTYINFTCINLCKARLRNCAFENHKWWWHCHQADSCHKGCHQNGYCTYLKWCHWQPRKTVTSDIGVVVI